MPPLNGIWKEQTGNPEKFKKRKKKEERRHEKGIGILVALAFAAILLPGCTSGGGRGGGGEGRPFIISQSGGTGGTGNGGGGGYLNADSYGPKGVQFVGSAAMDTSVKMPGEPAPEFGDDVAIIATNTVVDVYVNQGAADADATLLDGELFLILGSASLIFRDRVGGDYVATGLQVLKNKTLTFGLNMDWGGLSGQDAAYIYFDHDIEILGRVTVKPLDSGTVSAGVIENRAGAPATAKDKGYLELESYRFFLRASGTIDTAGDDAAAGSNERGGYGGGQDLYSDSGGMFLAGPLDASGGNGAGTGDGGDGAWYQGAGGVDGIYAYADNGVLVNTGDVDASGGDGVNGGNAGYIYMSSQTFLVNKGDWRANGGYGSNGDGGNAYYLYAYTDYASLYNTGKWEANGGDGENGNGGGGGNLYFYSGDQGYVAETKILNNLSARGGYAGNGDAGSGGDLEIYNYSSGDMILSGNVDLTGGDCEGAGCDAGDGGYIYVYLYSYYEYSESGYVQSGDLIVRGNILIDGGDGAWGGDGGDIDLYNTYTQYSAQYPQFGILLVGYHEIKADGGDGVNGGSGGDIDFDTYGHSWNDQYVAPGPITLPLNYFARGGLGTNGTGGPGGSVYLETDPWDDGYLYPKGWTTATVSGKFLLTGGDGTASGGNGGYLEAIAYDLVEVSASIDTSGGDGTTVNANGGSGGGNNYFNATWDVKLSGTLLSNGGAASGTGTAGSGPNIYIYAGQQVQSSMRISADGGDGSSTGVGGNGGGVDIFSGTVPSVQSAPVSVLGGDGLTPGAEGDYWLDWTYMIGYH